MTGVAFVFEEKCELPNLKYGDAFVFGDLQVFGEEKVSYDFSTAGRGYSTGSVQEDGHNSSVQEGGLVFLL